MPQDTQDTGDSEDAVARAKQQYTAAGPLLACLPAVATVAALAASGLPRATYADAELHETGGFADPRLVLHTGISRLDRHPGAGRSGAVTVGWCLFGAARNVTGTAPAALPAAAPEALANPDAARALDLLAADNSETDEAAVEALEAPGAALALARFGAEAQLRHRDREPLHTDLGAWIYAAVAGPFDFGGVTADLVCIGSPVWIAREAGEDAPQ